VTRVLIAGAGGMLGRDLQAAFAGRDVSALDRAALDVTDAEAVLSAVEGHDVIVNAAAYTRVDDAETHEQDAHLINAVGAGNLARAAATHRARLVQVSTDYVFDGRATTPYPEDAELDPVSAYGRTKADGERLARELNPDSTIIVRTAWLYGEHGPNFARTMLRLAAERDTVEVVTDQLGQPTWTGDLAQRILEVVDSDVQSGTFHATNSGQASWYDFARAVFEFGGHDPDRVMPTDSSRFVRPAARPAYSVLGQDGWQRIGLAPLREWLPGLRDAFGTGALGAS
jgi:dTDP-4-dehydrorhamnose reductase